jgi:hypothetical protein
MPALVNDTIELRIRNQLERAFRHTFGAEQGLRVLVKLATQQMLAAGRTRPSIHGALIRIVNEHPASGTGRSSLLSGRSRAEALTTMMLSWSDGTTTTARSDTEVRPLHKHRNA